VRDVATLISTVLGEKIVLRVDNAAGEARVDADPVQLEQVIMNLVLNAKDAIEDTGEIDLSTRVIDTGAASGASGRPGSWVEVSVRDDGCGISPEGREHLFEPFFTTKERGHGLGLSMADTIVRRLGGSIEVDSKPGEGATFTIRLPQRP
jgi:signal transduction histidine kinase